MRGDEEPKTHPTLGVNPPVSSSAPWRLASATVLSGLRIRVSFVDATEGEIHLEQFIRSPRVAGTLFEALRDPALFAQARVVGGVLCWPNGADLAPDAMYDAIRATGTWVVEA